MIARVSNGPRRPTMESMADLRKLSRAVEQTGDSIVITDREGVIEYVNPAFERLTGYSCADAVGKTPRILRSGVHEASFYEEMWRTLLDSGVWRGVLVNRKKNGDTFFSEKTITALRDGRGRILWFVSTDRDITERKRVQDAQRALAEARDRLLQAEVEKTRFYREVIGAVTQGRVLLCDRTEVRTEGQLVLETELRDGAQHARLRTTAFTAGRGAGMSAERAADFELAIGEAAGNAVRHAFGGRAALYTCAERVVARVWDQGPGIRAEDLPTRVLLKGFSTQMSLGMGYTLMLQLVDRVWLATDATGTTVQLEKCVVEPSVEDALGAF